MAKYCPNCGTENADTALSCANCGVQFVQQPAPAQDAQPIQPGVAPAAPAQQKTDVCSIIGFVLSLVSNILCCGALNLPALILCIVGMILSKKGNKKGFGLALAGLIITIVFIIIWTVLNVLGYAATDISNYDYYN